MLTLKIPSVELWDEADEKFITIEAKTLRLEHSLFAISKWESKWHKPFLSKEEKTEEEVRDYISCMNLDDEPINLNDIRHNEIKQISAYIEDSMTATWFSEDRNYRRNSEQVTSELIYYWMVAYTIPFECQYWHLNRLLTLVRICGIKNQDPKKSKMSTREIMSRNKRLNAERKAKLKTKG